MRVHIIGAGLAGLSAAVHLAKEGVATRLYEAAPRAGGRCRSYHDPHLGCVIDNGNHVIMSGNTAAMDYLGKIGARDRLVEPGDGGFRFVDAATRARWSLRPGPGRVPWWIFNAKRRIPGTSAGSYLAALKLLRALPSQTVADILQPGTALYRALWEPLTIATLNTDPTKAAAQLMRPVLVETFLKGAQACRALVARESLADALVDPALAFIARSGAEVRLGCRVRALRSHHSRVASLGAEPHEVHLEPDDAVIVATPSWVTETLLPGMGVPSPGETIVNLHFRLPGPLPGDVQMVGVIGGLAQWVLCRGVIASATLSAAGPLADTEPDELAARCWRDASLALDCAHMPQPAVRVIKEKRATFAQTPESIARRPGPTTAFRNLFLAGDWTATGLPATIEGAIRSGVAAARAALRAA